jgi:hypothetical protein
VPRRFDHNPATGESLGLLVEEARTNIWTRSEEFDNAAWTKTDTTITSNAATAPDGSLTADKLIASATTAVHSLSRVKTIDSPSWTTIYVKAAEYTICDIYDVNINSGFRVNLLTGVISASPAFVFYATRSGIDPINNGWYRIRVGFPNSDTTINNPVRIYPNGAQSFTGDGTSGIYIWGAQLEAGSFPTSYIPTVASTVTRAADVASMTGTNFTSWYRQDEGTMFIQYKQYANQSGWRGIFSGGSGGAFPSLMTYDASGLAQTWMQTYTGPTSIDFVLPLGQQHKVAVGHKITSGISVVKDGGTASSKSYSVTQAAATAINFTQGYYSDTNNQHVSRLTYYPVRLPDAQLQALTAT